MLSTEYSLRNVAARCSGTVPCQVLFVASTTTATPFCFFYLWLHATVPACARAGTRRSALNIRSS
jgi:hypothetical protein